MKNNELNMSYEELIKRLIERTGETEQVIRQSFKENSGFELESILKDITEEDIQNWEV